MSFVNLMGDHVWTPDEIRNCTEAMVQGQVSHRDEHILIRRVLGAAAFPPGHPLHRPLSDEQMAELGRAAMVFAQAELAGEAAAADAALLQHALDAEAATRRLAQPPADPPTEDDGYERQAAESVLETMTPEVQALVDARAAARAPAEEPAP